MSQDFRRNANIGARISSFNDQNSFRKDTLFPSVTYEFSNEEIESTDWYTLVHRKKLRKAI